MAELEEFDAETVDNLGLVIEEQELPDFDASQFELADDYDEEKEVEFDEHTA